MRMKFILLLSVCLWAAYIDQLTGLKENNIEPNGFDSRENGRDGPPDGHNGPPDGRDGPPDKKNPNDYWAKNVGDLFKNKSENIPLHVAVRTGIERR